MKKLIPLLLLALAVNTYAQLAITEFLASNANGIQDELGNEEDWLEIQNTSTGTVSLSGWYLTDEPTNLRKWPMPAWTLAAGNRMVVFASNRNRTPAQTTAGQDNAGTAVSPRLATNFKIGAGAGGYLALSQDQPGGAISVISAFANYPRQVTDISYGTSVTTSVLVNSTSPVKALVPTVANGGNLLGATWRGGSEPFNDASWAAGTTGVGRSAAAAMVSGANLKLRLNANDAANLVTDTSGGNRNGVNGSGANNVAFFDAATTDTQATPVLRRGAIRFDQSIPSQVQVEAASHTDFNATSGTIMWWMKAGSVAGNGSTGMIIWNRRDSTGTWLTMKAPSDANAGKLFHQPNGGGSSFHSNARVDDGQWHHVAFVYNQAAGGTDTFYIDGVASGSVTHASAWAWPAAQPVTLGYHPTNNFWYRYNGLLDEVRMYNTALSAAQIASIYNGADEDVSTADIGLNVGATLPGNAGAFLRIPFNVPNPASFVSLRLTSRVNDGFVAYINGSQVDSLNAPVSPAFNSLATTTALATRTRVSDVSLGGLVAGTNMLTVHAMNNSTSDANFLAYHTLEGVSLGTANYLLTATPGTANSDIRTNIGPFINNVTGSPGLLVARPPGGAGSPAITVNATVTPSLRPLATTNPVQLAYRIMYNSETVINMTPVAGGVYTASIPTTGLTAGQMLRWRVIASDNTAVQATAPEFLSPTDSDQYYGTVALDNTVTQLPIYHVFVPNTYVFNNTNPVDTDNGGRASFFYDGELYDNVFIRIKGDTTRTLFKRAHRVDFNSGHQFRWAPGQKRLRELNLNAEYVDPSYSRQFLSMWLHRLAGTGAPNHFPVRTHINGVFWQLAFHTETQDFELLDNMGLDPNGAFYCSVGQMAGASGEKQTRTTESTADMASFVTAVTQANLATRETNIFDQVDLPAVINYIAVARLTQEADDVWANMCIHRDSDGTGEWRIVPFDTNLSWGQLYYGQETSHTTLFATADNNKSHPLYGGSACTPSYATTLWNRFYDAIISVPRTRSMLLRRTRTLMDNYLQPPGTVNGFFEQQLDAHIARISQEAVLDRAQWGWPPVGGPYGLGNDDLTTAVNEIKTLYIAPRRTHFFVTHTSTTNVGIGNANSAGIPATPQPATFPITIAGYDYNPTDAGKQNAEWIQLTNPNAFDADISGWSLTGAVKFTFKAGTVISAGGSIYISPRQQSFRARSTSPRGGEGRFVVGPYDGQISARGEIIELRNTTGALVTSANTPAMPTASQQQLRITELNFNPPTPTPAETAALPGVGASDFEWIELLNTGASSLNIGGATFTKGITFTFPAGYTVAAGARIILVANQPAFIQRYGAGATIAGTFAGNLDNSGEEIEIIDPNGEVVLDFRYENSWFPPADGAGRTLVVRNALPDFATYDNPTHWAISGNVNGSPGTADSDFANHFDGWRWDHFAENEIYLPSPPNPSRTSNNALVGPAADPDGDGLNNTGEYAFCRNPRSNDNTALATPSIVNDGGVNYLAITFKRRHKALDVSYTVETTDNLAGPWTPTTQQFGATVDLGNGVDQVTFRDTVARGAVPRFIRVRAVKP